MDFIRRIGTNHISQISRRYVIIFSKERDGIEYIALLVSICAVVVPFIFSILNYRRATKNQEEKETSNMVSLKADLKYMSKQLGDITNKLEKLEDSVSTVSTSITENKTNIVTLFKKYDELKQENKEIRKRLERLENAR